MRVGRREFVRAAAGLIAFASPPTQLILLGTGGGPSPKRLRSAPAQLILVGDDAYVVDCGNGVARQMVSAGVALSRIRAVFITHHHSDHDADYGNLLLMGWIDGLKPTVDAYGPPPLARLTTLIEEVNKVDIETRIADEGRAPFAGLVKPHEITTGGVVMQRAGLKVTAALVDHPPIRPALAYRFDAPGRSIVISGDTAPSPSLIALAKDADILVHEVLYLPAVERMVGNERQAARLREHLLASHTPSTEVGRIAAAAGVKMLVLSHFVPGDDPAITDEMWAAGARAHFEGKIVVGRDLMVL